MQIVCSSNYQDQDCDLYGPNGIIHTDCTSDGCQVTLSLINSGQYYCELRLDGFSIKSDPEPINITDTTPAQPIITTAPPDPSVYTIIISLGSVGGLELIAVIVVAILLCVFIILYCRHRGQNGYQQIPNGKITHKSCHLVSYLHGTLLLPCTQGFPTITRWREGPP